MKKLNKREDLLKCKDKVIAFWSKGGDRDALPHFYEWVTKINEGKLFVRIYKNGRWEREREDGEDISKYQFKGNDWFVMEHGECIKRRIMEEL